MMLRLFLMLVLGLMSTWLLGQGLDLPDFNQGRLQHQRTAMLVLGGWAAANMATGAALMNRREGSERYFHQMNLGWNAVNLTIAGLGYWAALKSDPASFDLFATVDEQYKFQKILLLNTGLDVGYMVGGLYLMERAKTATDRPERLRGFGRSIVLQGGFLFAFDLANYFISASHNSQVRELLGQLQPSTQGIGLSWVF